MTNSPGGGRGPTKDAVVRATIENHLPTSISWMLDTMGRPRVPEEAIHKLASKFPLVRSTREADLLIPIGPNHLMHVEYESAPRRDLWHRMLEYRALIMQEHKKADLIQVVIVLGDDPVIPRDEAREDGFRLGLVVIRLPVHDPDDLLSRPGLEPLAILSQRSDHDPESIYRRAVTSLTTRHNENEEDQETLLMALIALAFGVLPVPTIEKLQEEGMFTYEEIAQQMREAPISGQLMRDAESRGLERGLERGREEGREETYTELLKGKFGQNDKIPAAVRALIGRPHYRAIRLVLDATSVDDLPTE